MMEKVFDPQFWVIMIILSPILFFGGRWLKKVMSDTIIHSVSGVVEEQWGQMFKKLDEYKCIVEGLGTDIEQLKKDCEELGKKATLNRKDIDAILLKVQGLK
jgi:hypothetical protein